MWLLCYFLLLGWALELNFYCLRWLVYGLFCFCSVIYCAEEEVVYFVFVNVIFSSALLFPYALLLSPLEFLLVQLFSSLCLFVSLEYLVLGPERSVFELYTFMDGWFHCIVHCWTEVLQKCIWGITDDVVYSYFYFRSEGWTVAFFWSSIWFLCLQVVLSIGVRHGRRDILWLLPGSSKTMIENSHPDFEILMWDLCCNEAKMMEGLRPYCYVWVLTSYSPRSLSWCSLLCLNNYNSMKTALKYLIMTVDMEDPNRLRFRFLLLGVLHIQKMFIFLHYSELWYNVSTKIRNLLAML